MPAAKRRKLRQQVVKPRAIKPRPMSARKKALLAGAGITAASAAGYLIYQKVKK